MKKIYLIIFLLSGITCALPFVFQFLFPLSWVSFVPTILMLLKCGKTVSKKTAYLIGTVFGIGYFGVMYYWFWYLHSLPFMDKNPIINVLLMLLCWSGLTALHSLEFGTVTLLYRVIAPKNNSPFVGALTFTALFAVFEWQQTLFWRGVPWARLALTQGAIPAIQQSSSLFGSIFTGAIIIFTNALLALSIHHALPYFNGDDLKSKLLSLIKVRKSQVLALCALLLFISNLAFGVIRIAVHDEKNGNTLTAAVIQGNISSLEKWAVSDIDQFVTDHLTLTYDCVNETGASLIVWSESVIPLPITEYPHIENRISQVAYALGVTILVGGFDTTYNENGEYYDHNAIYLFGPDGLVSETRYYKRHLVPFGEYTPAEGLITAFLPILEELNLLSLPLTPGTDSNLFDTEYGKIGSLICFDSIYHQLSLDSVRDGANLLTISTNDSWFSDSAALYQHNGHAVLRAIETGRYILRSANTGISTVIDSEGKILSNLPPLEKGYASAQVYTTDERTLYSYVGDVFVYLCIAALSCFAIYDITLRRKSG